MKRLGWSDILEEWSTMPKGGKMWSLVLVMGCGEKEDAVDTAESSVVSTPELDEFNECGGESVTGVPMGT